MQDEQKNTQLFWMSEVSNRTSHSDALALNRKHLWTTTSWPFGQDQVQLCVRCDDKRGAEG